MNLTCKPNFKTSLFIIEFLTNWPNFCFYLDVFLLTSLFFNFIFRLERSKVRVTFFQSSKPQQISPPSSDNQFYFGDNYFNNNSLIDSFLQNSSISETDSSRMTAAVIPPDFDRQIR